MHEMGIALQIVEIATASLPQGQDIKVEKVNLRIGKLAAVVPDSLRFSFEVITKDTPFAGSELVIQEVPVVVRCRKCGSEWTAHGADFSCKQCPDSLVDLVSGREIEIVSMEVAD